MLTLRAKIVLLIGLLLAGTALLVLVIVRWTVQNEITRTVRSTSARTLKVLESSISHREQLLSQGIRFLSDRPGTRSLGDTDTPTINDHLKGIHSLIGADWMAFCDLNGSVKGVSNKLFEIGSKPGQGLGVEDALDGKSWQGALFKDGRVYLVSTFPIVIAGFVKGVLIGGAEIDPNFVKQIGMTSSADVLISYEGKRIASSFADTIDQPSAGLVSARIRGQALVGNSSPLKQLGLSNPLEITALVPTESITRPFDEVWRFTLATFGIAVFVALAVAGSLAASITRPVAMLVKAAETLQSGGWPKAFMTKRRDELGYLLGSFDMMSSGLQQNQAKLLTLLDVDPLTQLWNQRSFRDKLDACLLRAVEDRGPLALLMIDLDNFGDFNRINGSEASDRILVEVAALIRQEVGELDVCGRFNADEFILVTHLNPAEDLAENLRQLIFEATGVTVSVGVAHHDLENSRSDLLILAAKMAKDTAKQGGRNRVRTFEAFAAAGDLHELKQFLQHGSYAAMRALAEAVDAKDEYTRGHSTRVAQYARDIARVMGFDEGFVELVHVAGTLHDVGKIGVPDNILKKSDKLTDEEFEEVKRHPALGEKIVGQLPMLKDALPGVRHHHEKWDGTGYPDELKGEEIPILARILSVADTFDAMTSDRPYRKGMPVEVARRKMLEGAGTQFDPALLPAFEAWLDGTQTLAA